MLADRYRELSEWEEQGLLTPEEFTAAVASLRAQDEGVFAVSRKYIDILNDHLPRGWTLNSPHLQCYAEHIDALEAGQIDRLAMHVPPRHAKTETVSVPYPVVCLGRRPTENVLVTGYNDRFARRLSRKSRSKAIAYGLQLDPSKKGTDEWSVIGGGSYVARGVGSPPTGIGFHRIIIEDPIRSREDADSEAYRERAEDWYADEIYTRIEPGGAVLLIGTLWAYGDIYDFIKSTEPDKWTTVRLPALAEECDRLGRSVGEALWPDRYPVDSLERIRSVMLVNEGERSWQALYQQNPQLADGNFFKKEDFRLINSWEVPKLDYVYRGYDMATSVKETGHYTASTKLGVDQDLNIYIFDVTWWKKEFPDARKDIIQTALNDGHEVAIGVENKMAGMSMVQDLQRVPSLIKHSIWEVNIKGQKKQRAQGWAARARAGHLFLVKPNSGVNWIPEFINICLAFDGSETPARPDDPVDSTSIAFQMVQPMEGGSQPDEQESRPKPGTEQYYDDLDRRAGGGDPDEWDDDETELL